MTLSGNHDRPLPAVSVVIPALTGDAGLFAALDSALAQDYPGPTEIIVADGSAPGDDRLARVLRARYPAVRIVANPTRRTPAGLNRAIAIANGGVIARCDTHAELPVDYLTRAVALLRSAGASAVGGRQSPVVDDGASRFRQAAGIALSSPFGSGDSRYKTGGPPGWTDQIYLGVFLGSDLARVAAAAGRPGQPYHETLTRNQDYELSWQLRQKGNGVWLDPSLRVAYRPRAGLGPLAAQYYEYGYWKEAMLAMHPRSLRWRQLAAPALVAGLVASAAGPAAGLPASLCLVLPMAYAVFLGLALAVETWRWRRAAVLLLPVVLTTMHLCWGGGFLVALLRRAPGRLWRGLRALLRRTRRGGGRRPHDADGPGQ